VTARAPSAAAWRVRILAATWLSYAGFYVCRKNFAIVKSAVLDQLQISTVELAHIFTAYLVAYMLGQFLTGYLGRRVTPRRLLLAGMGTTLVCNVAFGFCFALGPRGYWPMISVMVVNGFAQATGWAGNVGVLGNWLRRRERGRVMALWATSYQLGSIVAKIFAAFMLGLAGAVWSFWGPAVVMAAVWLLFFLLERDHPEQVGLDPIVPHTQTDDSRPAGTGGIFAGWDRTVVSTILFMGLCYLTFKFLRYSLDSWSPLAIKQLFALNEVHAGYVSTLFDWAGFLGVLFAGWISDRLFSGRRHQTILLMAVGMLAAFALLWMLGLRSVWLFGAGLALCGFMLMGPDSLLSGVGAIDVGGRRGAVTAAALINGLGSIGPILQEELLGWVLTRYGHGTAFGLLFAVAALAIVGAGYLSLRSRRNLSSL
jgi:sugar phosphate permease